MNTADMNVSERAVRLAFRKARWRLIPFLILCYLIAFLDRVNVGFAALTMNKELGLINTGAGFHVEAAKLELVANFELISWSIAPTPRRAECRPQTAQRD